MHVSTSQVKIDAGMATVWAAITEPRYVKMWQFGCDLETDWSMGSTIRFTVEIEGRAFEQWGEVMFVDAPRELRYSLFSPRPGMEDVPENRFTMTYLLEDMDGKVQLTVMREDPRPIPTGKDMAASQEAESQVMGVLRDLCESLLP